MVASLVLTTLSLIVTVFVLRMFFHDPSKPVPRWLIGKNKMMGITPVEPKQEEEGIKDSIEFDIKGQLPHAIAEYFRRMTEKEAENRDDEDSRADWERAARNVDKFCFVVMLIMTIGLLVFLIIGMNVG